MWPQMTHDNVIDEISYKIRCPGAEKLYIENIDLITPTFEQRIQEIMPESATRA